MVKTTGGYKCLICGNEYTDKQIKAENDKLKEKGML
jgi:DNA-directed RNA polymerase subunit RPC12/RpoP